MSFMDSYKRLDNLCKTFPDYPKGISSYIEIMECCKQSRYQCIGWNNDYDLLKAYRHVRNQIAHENGVYEDEVCESGDEEWLNAFRMRVLEQTDPLSRYYKAQRVSIQGTSNRKIHNTAVINTTPSTQHKSISTFSNKANPSQSHSFAPKRKSHKYIGCIIALIATVAVVAVYSAFIAWILFYI